MFSLRGSISDPIDPDINELRYTQTCLVCEADT